MQTIEAIIKDLKRAAQEADAAISTAFLAGCETRGDLLEALMDHVDEWQAVDDHWLPLLRELLPADAYAQLTDGYLRDRLLDTLREAGIEVVTDKSLMEAALGHSGNRKHRVYHGSGAYFNHFDEKWIGTGQGFTSYGWGFYFTEVEEIGQDYAKEYAGNRLYYKGKLMDTSGLYNPWRLIADVFKECNKHIAMTRDRVDKLESYAEEGYMKETWIMASAILKGIRHGDLKVEPERVLYSVDIPEDRGDNYLYWEKPVPESVVDVILDELSNQPIDRAMRVDNWVERQVLNDSEFLDNMDPEAVNDLHAGMYAKSLANDILREHIELYTDFFNNCYGSELYEQVQHIFGDGPMTGAFFRDMGIVGISYPAQFLCNGGREDGSRNYVMFDASDILIEDKYRFLRASDQTVYGLTDGKRIFVDRSVATAATPIHEYAHLWITAYSQQCPEEWACLTQSLKGTPQWAETVTRCPELKSDSEIADELLATYSGERGRERLLAELDRSGSTGWAGCIQAALRQVWQWVGCLFNSPTAKLDWMADRILVDMLRQRNPIQGEMRMKRSGHGIV